ncbi:MAG: hypothetical protein JST16_09605 [Bdellovibrionales bacterium]|nr:hypothetical protein [Bdellovibrionales bacterium]
MTPNPPQSHRRGQAMSEYLILVALISVGSIAVIQVLARNLHGKLAEVSNHLGGYDDAQIKGVKAKQELYQIHDLGNFGDAIRNNGDR